MKIRRILMPFEYYTRSNSDCIQYLRIYPCVISKKSAHVAFVIHEPTGTCTFFSVAISMNREKKYFAIFEAC